MRSPFDDDEQLDRDALERLLGGAKAPKAGPAAAVVDGDTPEAFAGGIGVPDPFAPPPTSNTMPVGGPRATVTPTASTGGSTGGSGAFQGQGAGWRGLDLTPVTNRGINPLHGFNLDRAFAGTDTNSTKDAFARWASGIQTPLAGLDHAGVAGVINQNLDRARQMGLNILEVDGDRILIDTFEHGPMWVDVVENAGGDPTRGEIPAWAWQLQDEGGLAPGGAQETPGGATGGASGRQAVSPIAPPEMPLTGGGDENTAMDDILAEIEALMSGRGSPMDARALQGMLR